MVEIDPVPLLRILQRHGVRFVVIGGVAAISQGYPLPTEDLDVTPARDPENLERIAAALRELGAELRVTGGERVSFPVDPKFLAGSDSWTLATPHGGLDLVFRPAGTEGYDDLKRDASETELAEGLVVAVASLRDVIRSKETSNRIKDQAQLPALRQTLEVIRRRERERGEEPT
ncbi:MAG: hypothetical protein H0W14_08140 [Actinobacteria bacterium]|nr:hypothetical protein [Actinomycetota bacterium]